MASGPEGGSLLGSAIDVAGKQEWTRRQSPQSRDASALG